MAYDERLAERVRAVASDLGAETTERAMFGGLCFMVDGKMFVGVLDRELMVRVGPDAYEAALAEKHVREMDFTGRPLRGYVYVGIEGLRSITQLRDWIGRGLAGARRAKKAPRTRGRALVSRGRV